jgi:hypothetical protein
MVAMALGGMESWQMAVLPSARLWYRSGVLRCAIRWVLGMMLPAAVAEAAPLRMFAAVRAGSREEGALKRAVEVEGTGTTVPQHLGRTLAPSPASTTEPGPPRPLCSAASCRSSEGANRFCSIEGEKRDLTEALRHGDART